MNRKQQLLKQHRRNKRLGLLVGLVALLGLGIFVQWLLPLLLLPLLWVAHEAWFADHLFYSPAEDYQYQFPPQCLEHSVEVVEGVVRVKAPLQLAGDETLVLALRLKSRWLGRFFDPAVVLDDDDCQAFERGVAGLRYLNLTGLGESLAAGQLRLRGRHCRLAGVGQL
ncbi:MAG: PIG-L family deacetylase, partial [Pseudomonas sp.]